MRIDSKTTSSSNVQSQQETNQKGFNVTNSGHGSIYCNSILLSVIASTSENDVLVMRLASWIKVLVKVPQLPKPKSSYKKPYYNALNILLHAIKKRKRRRCVTYQVSYNSLLDNGVIPKVHLFYVKQRSITPNKSY